MNHYLKYLNKHKKDIETAKAAGDLEKEREYILSATSLWGPMVFNMFNSKVNVEGLDVLVCPEDLNLGVAEVILLTGSRLVDSCSLIAESGKPLLIPELHIIHIATRTACGHIGSV